MGDKKKVEVGRNFATVVYEESAPVGWAEIVKGWHVQGFISPLHNKDKNEQGEDKKPHWHVLLTYSGNKSLAQMRELFSQINGVGCEVVQSKVGYARYLCHLDDEDKAPYLPQDVVRLGGADYTYTCALATDKYNVMREIQKWCVEEQIIEFSDLFEYAAEHEEAWFQVLCDGGTFTINAFLRSRRYRIIGQQ